MINFNPKESLRAIAKLTESRVHLHVAYNISFSAQAFAQCTARGEERRGEESPQPSSTSDGLRGFEPSRSENSQRALEAQNKTPTPTDRTRTQLVKAAASRCPNPGRPAGPCQQQLPPRARGPAVRVVGRPLSLTCRCQQQPTNPLARQSIFSVRPLARTRGARRGGAATAQCRRPRPREGDTVPDAGTCVKALHTTHITRDRLEASQAVVAAVGE